MKQIDSKTEIEVIGSMIEQVRRLSVDGMPDKEACRRVKQYLDSYIDWYVKQEKTDENRTIG